MIALVKMTSVTIVLALAVQTAHAAFTVTSPVFKNGGMIPQRLSFSGYGCTGRNVSPELDWSGAPADTKTFALTVFDTDARNGQGWWHWVVFNIPASISKLQTGAGSGSDALLPQGAVQGRNDFETVGYGGPCPPPGTPHHYHFTLYALDDHIDGLSPLASGPLLVKTMRGHILAKTELVGLFSR